MWILFTVTDDIAWKKTQGVVTRADALNRSFTVGDPHWPKNSNKKEPLLRFMPQFDQLNGCGVILS